MPLKTILITGYANGSYGNYLAKEYLWGSIRITFLPLDVTDRYSIENAYRSIIQGSGGKLDIIFHPATFRNMGMAIESSHITPMLLVPLS
ncbi:uncharacterized protein ASPGLDRAFT_37249 [Aspergillus glaucus CBS 516.65]|uniref:Uncharacterized protein n=1 Tax=Aspergillus glaucus CBS 516.65 TaxID=1160497 RepID=A0A1L9VF48_ASPGL|nr:hypothetical protein ASPGLDRAFT_37249 [Aspergillus glaucus CBS 516.65]OJJ82515.1 hypothetical protein ASPGLDRAFT_37249 [Aspergillus glaucus CBS 516.65]